jgi:hypothetical protein
VAAATAAAVRPDSTERARSYTSAASGFWLQLGAFGRGDGAYSFQQRVAAELDWLSPLLTVFAEGGLHRLQAGPYASRDQAREAAERIRAALALVPVIVERGRWHGERRFGRVVATAADVYRATLQPVTPAPACVAPGWRRAPRA